MSVWVTIQIEGGNAAHEAEFLKWLPPQLAEEMVARRFFAEEPKPWSGVYFDTESHRAYVLQRDGNQFFCVTFEDVSTEAQAVEIYNEMLSGTHRHEAYTKVTGNEVTLIGTRH